MLAPLHSIIDKGEHEKYLFLPHGKFTHDSMHPQDQLVTAKRQKGDYASFSELSNIVQNVLS